VTPGRKLNPYEQWAIQQKLESKTNFYNKIFKPYDGVGLPPLQIPLGAHSHFLEPFLKTVFYTVFKFVII